MSDPRWAIIAEFVKTRLYELAKETDDPQYRWRHTLRVTAYGRQLDRQIMVFEAIIEESLLSVLPE